jgi:hypothetical protein
MGTAPSAELLAKWNAREQAGLGAATLGWGVGEALR